MSPFSVLSPGSSSCVHSPHSSFEMELGSLAFSSGAHARPLNAGGVGWMLPRDGTLPWSWLPGFP